MITPKEFDQERENFRSLKYEEALKIVEDISNDIRSWANTDSACSWFKDSGSSKIWISDDVKSVLPIRDNKILRELVFEEFKKSGWDIWQDDNDNYRPRRIYFRPIEKLKEQPWWKNILFLFGWVSKDGR